MISARKKYHDAPPGGAGVQPRPKTRRFQALGRSPPESGACAQAPSAPCVPMYGENLISTLCHRVPATDKQRGLHVVPKPFESQREN